ncbi:hypothetical protein [Streptomyces sp. CBMA123]|uniref:hypothetical protein n=1 Tax=Streptomyces sp. CBMA123 TaxID=1896313 RepID=UPI001661DA09|nr:hypothetical protein [Streptomyces sp. CBMA123]MBD0692780.1 hypothetical protein [Streptomyces sp. CBMA123]
MARRNPKREYREVVIGPAKHELNQAPDGRSPLADYRAANPAGRAPSVGTLLQIDAVRSTCPCRDCTTRRSAA